MKKFLLFAFILVTSISQAQVPQGISYQAIALTGSGTPVANGNVGVRLSILNSSPTGTVVYTETHARPTNAHGLFNLVIGQGTPTTGSFAAINWSTASKFLKVEMDAAGGTNYLLVGTTQLLSVPYAMFAGNTNSVSPAALNGAGTSSLLGTTYLILDGNSIKGYYNGTWASQTFSQQIYSDDVIEENGTFLILDGNSVKSFSKGVWSTQAFSTEVYTDDVIISNDAFLVLASGNQVKGFSNGTWGTRTFSQQIYTDDVLSSNGAFIVLDGNTAAGFYNGVWTTQTCSGEIYTDDVEISNGHFLIRDGNSIKSFHKGNWATQTFSQQIYQEDFIQSVTE